MTDQAVILYMKVYQKKDLKLNHSFSLHTTFKMKGQNLRILSLIILLITLDSFNAKPIYEDQDMQRPPRMAPPLHQSKFAPKNHLKVHTLLSLCRLALCLLHFRTQWPSLQSCLLIWPRIGTIVCWRIANSKTSAFSQRFGNERFSIRFLISKKKL